MYKRNVWPVFVVSVISFWLSPAERWRPGRPRRPAWRTSLPARVRPLSRPAGRRPLPAIEALASYFGVPFEEIKALHDSGVGLGVIAEAYVLSSLLELTPRGRSST